MAEKTVIETAQYLTFRLGEEEYGVDVSRVKEVLELLPITRVPKTPEFMRGVVNVRGSVVPVVDLRLKFGMEAGERTVDTCIIVMEVALGGEVVVLGAIADAVQEVIELDPEHIEPSPSIGTSIRTDFIQGMGKKDDEFIILLNVEKVFSEQELNIIQEVEKGS